MSTTTNGKETDFGPGFYDMISSSGVAGPVFAVQWMHPDLHPDARPLGEPGLVEVTSRSKPGLRIPFSIRSQVWRPDGGGSSLVRGVRQVDVMQLTTAIYDTTPSVLGRNALRAVEAELNTVGLEDAMPYDLSRSDNEFVTKMRSEHPELFDATLEVDDGPYDNIARAYMGVFSIIRGAANELGDEAGFDTLAARIQDVPNQSDFNNNKYVAAVVDELNERMGGDFLTNFVGHGIHEHHDVHMALAPVISKYLRGLAPILNSGLLAAPFGFGELVPNMADRLGNNELKQYDGVQPHSIRYLTRAWRPEFRVGGVGLPIVHSNIKDTLRFMDGAMLDGYPSQPGRAYGPYVDVRVRPDITSEKTPNQPGRIELCVKDSGGYRLPTLLAYGRLSVRLIRALEQVTAAGPEAISRMHQDYPELFGKNNSDTEYVNHQLTYSHINSVSLAYEGNDANLLTADGNERFRGEPFTPRVMMSRLFSFITRSGLPMNKQDMITIYNSLQSMGVVEGHIRQHHTVDGDPDSSQFYECDFGTQAQWEILSARALKDKGFKDAEIIRIGTVKRSRRFRSYMSSLVLPQIAA